MTTLAEYINIQINQQNNHVSYTLTDSPEEQTHLSTLLQTQKISPEKVVFTKIHVNSAGKLVDLLLQADRILKLKSLVSISFNHLKINTYFPTILTTLLSMRVTKEIDFSYCGINDSAVNTFACNFHSRDLNLRAYNSTELDKISYHKLWKVGRLGFKVKKLNLSYNAITIKGLTTLFTRFDTQFASVQKLDLQGMSIALSPIDTALTQGKFKQARYQLANFWYARKFSENYSSKIAYSLINYFYHVNYTAALLDFVTHYAEHPTYLKVNIEQVNHKFLEFLVQCNTVAKDKIQLAIHIDITEKNIDVLLDNPVFKMDLVKKISINVQTLTERKYQALQLFLSGLHVSSCDINTSKAHSKIIQHQYPGIKKLNYYLDGHKQVHLLNDKMNQNLSPILREEKIYLKQDAVVVESIIHAQELFIYAKTVHITASTLVKFNCLGIRADTVLIEGSLLGLDHSNIIIKANEITITDSAILKAHNIHMRGAYGFVYGKVHAHHIKAEFSVFYMSGLKPTHIKAHDFHVVSSMIMQLPLTFYETSTSKNTGIICLQSAVSRVQTIQALIDIESLLNAPILGKGYAKAHSFLKHLPFISQEIIRFFNGEGNRENFIQGLKQLMKTLITLSLSVLVMASPELFSLSLFLKVVSHALLMFIKLSSFINEGLYLITHDETQTVTQDNFLDFLKRQDGQAAYLQALEVAGEAGECALHHAIFQNVGMRTLTDFSSFNVNKENFQSLVDNVIHCLDWQHAFKLIASKNITVSAYRIQFLGATVGNMIEGGLMHFYAGWLSFYGLRMSNFAYEKKAYGNKSITLFPYDRDTTSEDKHPRLPTLSKGSI